MHGYRTIRPIHIFIAGYSLAAIIAIVLTFHQNGFSAAFVSALLGAAFLLVLVKTRSLILDGGKRRGCPLWLVLLGTIAVSVVIGVTLEAMTLFGDPLHSPCALEDWSPRRVLIFSCLGYCLWVLALRLSQVTHSWMRKREAIPAPMVIVVCNALVIMLLLGCIAIFARGFSESKAIPHLVYAACICACVVSLCFLRRHNASVVCYFIVISFSLGVCIACVYPAVSGAAPDDEIHYNGALRQSYVEEPSYTYGDEMVVNRPKHEELWTLWGPAYDDALNAGYRDPATAGSGLKENDPGASIVGSPMNIAYIPSAIGLWLGRFLHLPLTLVVVLGRLTSLFFYIAVGAFAIKAIPVKRLLLTCFLLLPTNLFIAANYSRDTWLVVFCILGFALLLKQVYQNDKLCLKDMLPSMVAFLCGLLIKPVYVPILGLYALVGKKRFKDSAEWVKTLLSVLALILIVCISFVLPFLVSGTGGNDMRGGSDVDSGGQIAHILSNPIEYAVTLSAFFFDYLNPFRAYEYTWLYSLPGTLYIERYVVEFTLPIILLIIAAVADRTSKSSAIANWRTRSIGFLMFVACLVLVTTSMYVAFTPVGLDTVNGMHTRYAFPMLFPFLALVLNFKAKSRSQPQALALIAVTAVGACSAVSIYLFEIAPLVPVLP